MMLAHKLVTNDGFITEFWRVLAEKRSEGENVTQEDVFNELNAEFSAIFGEPRFPSFDAFRKMRDRKSAK